MQIAVHTKFIILKFSGLSDIVLQTLNKELQKVGTYPTIGQMHNKSVEHQACPRDMGKYSSLQLDLEYHVDGL